MGQLVCALFPWPGDQRSWISARRERGRGPAENTRSQEGTGVGRGGGRPKEPLSGFCWGFTGAARTGQKGKAKSQRGTRRHQARECR